MEKISTVGDACHYLDQSILPEHHLQRLVYWSLTLQHVECVDEEDDGIFCGRMCPSYMALAQRGLVCFKLVGAGILYDLFACFFEPEAQQFETMPWLSCLL